MAREELGRIQGRCETSTDPVTESDDFVLAIGDDCTLSRDDERPIGLLQHVDDRSDRIDVDIVGVRTRRHIGALAEFDDGIQHSVTDTQYLRRTVPSRGL
ncbi:hypothetical protein CH267_13005 [Rhodococcus sp. 06-621-2]|nr:hypothetical protein CH267_13005 [Rhodococcus sp. 06-621-2]